MKNNTLTLNELFNHPDVRKTTGPQDMERIEAVLEKESNAPKEPVFIRALLGLGAWVAAIFLTIFSYEMEKSSTGAIIFGCAFMGAGIILSRIHRAVFLQQLALALAFAGNLLILYGVGEKCDRFHEIVPVLVLTHAALCLLVYPLLQNSIYRFLAPIGLTILLIVWIVDEKAFDWIHVLIAAEAVLTGVLFLKNRVPQFFKPLAYAAAFMLPSTLLFWNLYQTAEFSDIFLGRNHIEPLWPATLFLAGGLIYIYFHLSGGLSRIAKPWMILALGATIFLGIFSTPGILVVIGLLVLGYSLDEWILTWLAYVFLPVFLIVFYYNLQISLEYKSYIIMGSGLILLGVRWIAGRLMPKEVVR